MCNEFIWQDRRVGLNLNHVNCLSKATFNHSYQKIVASSSPTVGISAIITLRREFANLARLRELNSMLRSSHIRKVNVLQNEIDAVLLEVTYSDDGFKNFISLHC